MGGGRGPSDEEIAMRERMMMQQQQANQRGGGAQTRRAQVPNPPADDMEEGDDMEGDGPEEPQQPPEPPKKPENPPRYMNITTEDGITTFAMNRAPVNSLNLEVFEELNDWLMWHSYSDETKAIILTSSLSLVFSAGLDITELHKAKEERFAQFWTAFQEAWLILNTFPKPVIAAINGNSPAGGCVLALCCDYRVMARCPEGKPDKAYRIGLNETKLGIVAPPWVMKSMKYVIGNRKAERMLQLGETPTAEQALAIGLVDAVVEENQVLETAKAEAKKYLAVADEARWMTKDMVRKEVVEELSHPEQRRYDMEFFTQLIQNPEVQKQIEDYLARLRKK